MRFLLLFLFPVILFAQYSGYSYYDSWVSEDTDTPFNALDANVTGLWQATTDGQSGSLAIDQSTAGNNLTQATADYQPGYVQDVGWTCDGSNDFLWVADANKYVFGTDDFTVDAYISSTGFRTYDQIIAKDDGADAISWTFGLYGSASTIEFYHNSTLTPATGSSLSNDTKHLITLIREGDALRILVDGVQYVNSASYFSGVNLSNNTSYFRFGGRGGGATSHAFLGTYHEMRVSNKARTVTETLNYYNNLTSKY